MESNRGYPDIQNLITISKVFDDNFFDMNKYSGEGNIGRIVGEIKIDMSK